MLKKRLMWIGWPSFLMAGVMEMIVFSMADPADLHWFGVDIELSRQTVYAAGFFGFWFVISLSSALTLLLADPLSVDEADRSDSR